MGLINCPDCGKEISDRAEACINCGSPIQKILKENNKKKRKKKESLIGLRVWSIICIVVCTLITIFNLIPIYDIFGVSKIWFFQTISFLNINIDINFMLIFAFILSINYLIFTIKPNKNNFIPILITNTIVLIYNIIFFQSIINIFYIFCVIANVTISLIMDIPIVIKTKFHFGKFSIACIPSFIAITIFMINMIMPHQYTISNGYNYEDNYQDNEVELTPREKVIDFLKTSNVYVIKNCNTDACTFTYYGDDYSNPFTYTLDFNNSTMSATNYVEGDIVINYNYKNNTGTIDYDSIYGRTIDIYITFDEINNKYTYDYYQTGYYGVDISGVVTSMNDLVLSMRNIFIITCAGAGVDKTELIYETT